MHGSLTQAPLPDRVPRGKNPNPGRIVSIDALRGLIMFTMIFVNDIAGASGVPAWLKHYEGANGMTFVDLVFPAFLFIVGMAIPMALTARLAREPIWKTIGHVLGRTLALLAIGVMMVNTEYGPITRRMGWSATWWTALMYLGAILAFCSVSPRRRGEADVEPEPKWKKITGVLRIVGVALLVTLALLYRGKHGRLLELSPFSLHVDWFGILGLIGWAYFVGAIAFLLFRTHRTALLMCVVTAFLLFLADRSGTFDGLWIARQVSIGEALGSQAAITVAGVLLGSILLTPDTSAHAARFRFTLLFIVGCAVAAMLLHKQWGLSKNDATPSWCLWSCAVTAALWLWFYLVSDAAGFAAAVKPLALAGQNVLLAYLISEAMESWFELLHLNKWYEHLAEPNLMHAAARSAGAAVVILAGTAVVNRFGFRLKV